MGDRRERSKVMKVDRLAGYAWGVLALNLAVILWGAFVRATGSGAGCGSHWPLCNGDVVPRAAQVETLIEFTHRATSGLALIAVLVLFLLARKSYPQGHQVRLGASLSLLFIIVEALLGAGLVLFELVADNDTAFRAFSMIAHLVNTFVLVAVLTLTAWWASGGDSVDLRAHPRRTGLIAATLAALVFVGATGAIAALGDTLFPSATLVDGLRDSFSADSHPLIQLRKYHPVAAVFVGLLVVGVARHFTAATAAASVRAFATAVTGIYLAQLLAGSLNIILLAPVWLQLVHLLLADLLWIAVVLLGAASLAPVQPLSRPAAQTSGAARV